MADDIVVRPARSRADYDACVLLQRAVWGLEDIEITSAIQLIATTHAGGMLHVAETREGRTVGFAYAFPALRGGSPHLHSDMLAVLPEYQQRGVGRAPEVGAARGVALARGLSLITWTFDPMQARNANLNLRRLGGDGHRVPRELLRRDHVVAASRPAHRPPARALGPRVAAGGRSGRPRASRPRTVPRRRVAAHQRGEVAGGLAGLLGAALDLDAPGAAPRDPAGMGHPLPGRPARRGRAGRRRCGRPCRPTWAAATSPPTSRSTQEGGRRRPLYVLRRA